MAGKLSSLKKYAEDQDNANGILGMMMSNSSKSIFANEPIKDSKGSIERSHILLNDDAYRNDEVFNNVLDDNNERYLSQERDEQDLNGKESLKESLNAGDETNQEEKYSPMFSSVNRKETNQKIESIKLQNHYADQDVNSFSKTNIVERSAMNGINLASKPTYSRPVSRPPNDLPEIISKSDSRDNSSNSKIV